MMRIAHLLKLAGLLVVAPQWLPAQSNPLYIQFNPGTVKGALYKPDSGPAPTTAVLLIHRTSNFLSHLATRELSQRGFMVLGMNPRSDNNEAAVEFENNALDIKSGIEFLRKQPGITKVVLLGHSGGGPATSFYQAVAETGVSYCQGPNKLTECGSNLAGLPRADGLILMDAHPGISVNALRSINGAVLDDSDPRKIDPALDPFNPANGYNKAGDSRYSEAFKQKYFKAQADRMNRLIDAAMEKRRQMNSGQAAYADDDVFLVVRGDGARLMQIDTSIHPASLKPQKVIQNDGKVVTKIAESVRTPARGLAEQNARFDGGTRLLTVSSFLSNNAIRARDSLDDIDWCSSNSSTVCAVRSVTVPLLITAMGAHYFIRDNEIHYEVSASKDKDYVVIEGATHGGTPCTECEKTPGQYSNTVKNLFDYMAQWMHSRYPAK
jgi:hypothetical protein